MALTGAIMMGASAISNLGNSIAQANAYRAQAEVQKAIFEMNTRLSDFQSKDALQRGERTVEKHRINTKQLIGAQRVSLAAQGIDTESGSALQIVDNTRHLSEIDAMTISNNAWRESWGYKLESLSASFQGKMVSIAGENNARNTILTGIGNAAGTIAQGAYYYGRGNTGKPPGQQNSGWVQQPWMRS